MFLKLLLRLLCVIVSTCVLTATFQAQDDAAFRERISLFEKQATASRKILSEIEHSFAVVPGAIPSEKFSVAAQLLSEITNGRLASITFGQINLAQFGIRPDASKILVHQVVLAVQIPATFAEVLAWLRELSFGVYVILAGIVFGLAICFAPVLRSLIDRVYKRKTDKQNSQPAKPKNRYKTF